MFARQGIVLVFGVIERNFGDGQGDKLCYAKNAGGMKCKRERVIGFLFTSADEGTHG